MSGHFTQKFSRKLILLFIALLCLCVLSVFQTQYGLIALLVTTAIVIVLLRPEIAYFAMLALMPLEGFSVSTDVSYIKPVALLLIVGLALRFAISSDRLPKDDIYKYFILFFLGSFISLFFATRLTVSVMRLFTYLSLFLFYFFGRYFIRSSSKIDTAIDILLFSTLAVHLLGVAVHQGAARISGGIGDPNGYAAFLLVLLPLTLFRALSTRGFARLVYWGIFPVLIVMIILTGSRGGFLAFLGVIIVLITHYASRRLRTIAFSLLIALGMVYFFGSVQFWDRVNKIAVSQGQDASADVRLGHYKSAILIFLDHPFTGIGVNNFQFVNQDYGDSSASVVHDTYLEVLTGGGLFAFLPFLMILGNGWKKVRLGGLTSKYSVDLKICLKASFLAYLITAVFLSSDQAKTLWLLLSLISSAHYLTLPADPHRGNVDS